VADRTDLVGPGTHLDVTRRLRLQTAPEQIVDRILAAIAVGVLYAGERLPHERELAEMLGVGRSTVRQALSRLSALGVVEARRGRNGGTFVQPIRPHSDEALAVLRTLGPVWQEMELLIDYRCLIEALISRTAALRHTPDDRTAMIAALGSYRTAVTAHASRQADHALHAAIAGSTGNPHLLQLNQELVTAVNLGFTVDPYSEHLHERALAQHELLVDSILSKDSDRAAALTAEHFQITTLQPWRTALAEADRTQLPVPAGRKLTAPGVTTSSCNVPVDDR